MKLGDFGLLTDENIDAQIVTFLRDHNFDVRYVKEDGLTGSDDMTLLRLAVAENRVIVTFDSDFGTLAIATGESYLGLIYLRPGHFKPEFTIGTLQALLMEVSEVTPPFIIVGVRSGNSVRIRVR